MVKFLQKINTKYYALAGGLIVALAIVLMPQHTAYAWCLTPSGCVTDFISQFLLETLGRILAAFAFVLDGLLGLTQGIFDLDIIRDMWSIIKNFVNMFFIVILIVVAFATIFDRPKYRVQDLLPRLILVALLINFSLLIGQLVISVSDFMTHTFLEQFQHNPDGSVAISSEFMKGFALQQYPATDGAQFAADFLKDGIAGISSLLFFILALLVVIFVFVVAAAMILIRIPILWLLLIFSPFVWFASILPQGQKFWKQWWQHFISWAFFPPFYLFTLIFGKIFIENRDNLTAFAKGSHNDLLGVAGFTVANLLFYGVTLVIMGGGLYAAKKSSMFAGTGVLGAADFVGNWAKNRTLGTGISYNALMSAGSATKKKFLEEGLPGRANKLYGGERAIKETAEKLTGRFEQALGYTPSYSAEKEFLKNADKETSALNEAYQAGKIDINQIRAQAKGKATDAKAFAARRILAKNGKLDSTLFNETVQALSKNPQAQAKFIEEAAGEGKLKGLSPKDIVAAASAQRGSAYEYLKGSDFTQTRRQLFDHIKSDKKAVNELDQAAFDQGASLFGGVNTKAGLGFIDDTAKLRPDLAAEFKAQAKAAEEAAKGTPLTPAGIEKEAYDAMRTYLKDVKDISGLDFGAVWGNRIFQQAIYDKLQREGTARQQKAYRTRLENAVLTAGKDTPQKLKIIDDLAKVGAPRP